MKQWELRLIAHLLEMAGEHFGNHGCNDFDLDNEVISDPAEIAEFVDAAQRWNGDPQEEDQKMTPDAYNYDWIAMGVMAFRVREELAKVTP